MNKNILINNDELIHRLDTLYSYVMGVKDAHNSDFKYDGLTYCLNKIIEDIGGLLTALKNNTND